MRDEPSDLTCQDVRRSLRTYWGIEPAAIVYAPVGFGSHHWIASDASGPQWFVTADYLDPDGSWLGPTPEAIAAGITAAASAAADLAASGLEFLVSPLPDREGRSVCRVASDWTMFVLPYIDGWSTDHGGWTDPTERTEMAELIGRLHGQPCPRPLQRWNFDVPGRNLLMEIVGLDGASGRLDTPWETGVYGEPTRRLLATGRQSLLDEFGRYDQLVTLVRGDDEPWVVTHGEPHSGNVIRSPAPPVRMHLIDWDSMRFAPRERDLVSILGNDPRVDADVLSHYRRSAGSVTPRAEALELFRTWWALAEVCTYVREFARPHSDTQDMAVSWQGLQEHMP